MGNYLRGRITDFLVEEFFENAIHNDYTSLFTSSSGSSSSGTKSVSSRNVDLSQYSNLYCSEIEEGRRRKRERLLKEAKQKDEAYQKEEVRRYAEEERRQKVKIRTDQVKDRKTKQRTSKEEVERLDQILNEDTMLDYCGAVVPDNDVERLLALESYHVSDDIQEENFNKLAELACSLFNVPMAFVTLIGKHKVFFKGSMGFAAKETSRNLAMCSYALSEKNVLIVPDTLLDSRYENHPMVTGSPNIRFYCAAPLISDNGYKIGMFCLCDTSPREFDPGSEKLLENFARIVVRDLELSKSLQISQRIAQLEKSIQQFNTQIRAAFVMDELLDQACLTIVENMDVDYCEIFHREEGQWRRVASFGFTSMPMTSSSQNSLLDYVILSKDPFSVDNIDIANGMVIPDFYSQNHVQSLCCCPITSKFGIHGMIGVYNDCPYKWRSYERDYIYNFSCTLARAMDLNNWQKEITSERRMSDELLQNILPHPIAVRLKQKERNIAERIPSATVAFADIVGFTALSSRESPTNIVNFLSTVFSEFDNLTHKYDLDKIKTIGDAFMYCGGLLSHEDDHACAVIDMALDMIDYIHSSEVQSVYNISIRVGVATGPVVAGVIGLSKLVYDLWGDAVNVASRLESVGVPGYVQISDVTLHNIPPDTKRYKIECRGEQEIKGKGKMVTYLLTRSNEKDDPLSDA